VCVCVCFFFFFFFLCVCVCVCVCVTCVIYQVLCRKVNNKAVVNIMSGGDCSITVSILQVFRRQCWETLQCRIVVCYSGTSTHFEGGLICYGPVGQSLILSYGQDICNIVLLLLLPSSSKCNIVSCMVHSPCINEMNTVLIPTNAQ
jgi:hypothetical protein